MNPWFFLWLTGCFCFLILMLMRWEDRASKRGFWWDALRLALVAFWPLWVVVLAATAWRKSGPR